MSLLKIGIASVDLKRPTSYSTLSDNLVEILLNHENATAAFKLRQ